MQAEGVLRRDLAFRHHLLEELLAPRERLAETLLLGSDQVGDLALTFLELGVDGAHLPADDIGELVQERRLQAKAAAELDRTANHPAEHVAAAFIRRRHAFGNEEGCCPRVLDDDAIGLRRLVGGAVGRARALADPVDQRLEDVDLRERVGVLKEHRRALEPQACVDVLLRQRRQCPVVGEVELHEDEVPEFEVALALAARRAVGAAAAVFLTAVVIELRGRATRAGVGCLPEVLRARQAQNPFAGEELLPRLCSDLILAQTQLGIAGENRGPQSLGLEPHVLDDELPRVLDGALLEVVAEREVAQHLVEAEVPVREADVVEVVLLSPCPNDLLHRCHTRCGRLLEPEKPALHRLHTGDDEERGRVVCGRDHRCRWPAHVTPLLEEGEKALAQLGGGAHRVLILGAALHASESLERGDPQEGSSASGAVRGR